MKKLGVALLLLLAPGLAACNNGGDSTTETTLPAAINLVGEVILTGATNVRGGLSECVGAGPYADLFTGAPVVVTKADGRPLAVGKITYAVGTNFYLNQLDQCTFKVAVTNVPRVDAYEISIGRQDPVAMPFMSLYRRAGNFSFNFPRPGSSTATTTTTIIASTTTTPS